MAAKSLLPDLAGIYTSETLTASTTIGADTLDCSQMEGLAITVIPATVTGTIDIQESFDGTNWTVMSGADNMVLSATATTKFDITDGPFGLLRIDATDITVGTCVIEIIGV